MMTSYKHLGVRIAGSGTSGPELANRCSGARSTTGALARPILADGRLSQKTRLQLARATVESRLLHQAGQWCGLSAGDWERVEAVMVAPARRIAGAQRQAATTGHHTSNPEVRQALRHPTAKAAVDIQRLQLAARMQKLAPLALRALLQQPGAAEWKQEMAEVAAIMRCMLAPKLDELPSPLSEGGWRSG